MMKATVIMNTYNEDIAYLRMAIASYKAQKGVDIQLIISTVEDDRNMAFLKEQAEVAIMRKQDHRGKSPEGSFQQLNNAISKIKTPWVCFASSNDKALNDKLLKEITFCRKHRKKICYSDFYYGNNVLKTTGRVNLGNYNYAKHKQGNFVSDCALVSTRLFKKYTPFNWREFGNFSYWDLWLRIYRGEGNVFGYLDSPTWIYRAGGMHTQRRPSNYPAQRARMLSTHR